MTGIYIRPKPSIFGCFTTLICIVLLLVVISGIIRGCQQPYLQAMRVRGSDPAKAAHLFAEEIRLDRKSSQNSVFELANLNTPSVIPEIVDLMDLPDGTNIKEASRATLWESLQSQASQIAMPIPDYDPSGTLETRRAQQSLWRQWIKSHPLQGQKPVQAGSIEGENKRDITDVPNQ